MACKSLLAKGILDSYANRIFSLGLSPFLKDKLVQRLRELEKE